MTEDAVKFSAEFIGTMILVLLGDGVVANVCLKKTKGYNSGWIVITMGWGLAVFTAVMISGEISGAHLNPAVTIALAAAGKFSVANVPLFLIAQFLGGAAGALLVWLFYKDHFDISSDRGAILGIFATGPAIRNPFRNVLCEVIGTFVLVLAVLHATEMKIGEAKVGMGSLGAIPVAFVVIGIGLSLGGTTGYAINPARDLGPRLIHHVVPIPGKGDSDWGYAWIPVVGPILGALLAVLVCSFCPAR
ncbi:MAG TPA: MIP/aquaporin family protein [Sedimentisphaerales bacterium]|nr:MIP/aquaporin family protein [Sedimentisphaerales bacterium]HQG48502.1 MIP/aquaporin family protein [Sedimentisphaerales bacterium]